MFAHMSFEPSGMTTSQQIPFATSIPDYVVRYLATRYLPREAQESLGIHAVDKTALADKGVSGEHHFRSGKLEAPMLALLDQGAAPACLSCGNIMQRNGSCYICTVCGTTSGCS
jgi:ribonucleoside-diphosphate reductase alpha chain